LLGYAVLMMAVDEGHLLNISIAASQQRRGFGARLLLHVMDCARRAGASTLMLEVRPSNDKAIELYRQFGFEQIGVRRGYYPAPVGREDAVILRRPLTEVLA
jgi:ribosomal-protein-alanine N-acetyltransferase